MTFKVFERENYLPPSSPSVTIQRKGLFSLNAAAMQMLGNPEAIQFLWDRDRRVVGIQAVSVDASNAYPMRRQGTRARLPSAHGGPGLVAGTRFTHYIGLDTAVSNRWIPRMEGDILVVDLKQPGQPAPSNRNRKAQGTL